MRSSTEVIKKDGLRKRWFEAGFFVVWIGVIGVTFATWITSRILLLAAAQTSMCELLAATLCAALSWKLTIYNA